MFLFLVFLPSDGVTAGLDTGEWSKMALVSLEFLVYGGELWSIAIYFHVLCSSLSASHPGITAVSAPPVCSVRIASYPFPRVASLDLQWCRTVRTFCLCPAPSPPLLCYWLRYTHLPMTRCVITQMCFCVEKVILYCSLTVQLVTLKGITWSFSHTAMLLMPPKKKSWKK